MPYITALQRCLMDMGKMPENVGELNYEITRLVDWFLKQRPGGLNYENLNAVVGVLECAKLELYRRLAAPYEDQKIQQNGDVYTIGVKQK